MEGRKKRKRAREQVVVYLDSRDRELLERMSEESGLAKTEIFRRGLRKLAEETVEGERPGSSLTHLIETAADDSFPPDLSERHDDYLYGGGYGDAAPKKRARSR